jgi:hypothetical protein
MIVTKILAVYRTCPVMIVVEMCDGSILELSLNEAVEVYELLPPLGPRENNAATSGNGVLTFLLYQDVPSFQPYEVCTCFHSFAIGHDHNGFHRRYMGLFLAASRASMACSNSSRTQKVVVNSRATVLGNSIRPRSAALQHATCPGHGQRAGQRHTSSILLVNQEEVRP